MKRNRKIIFFNIEDYWFDIENYINSKSIIKILHTDKILNSKYYNLSIKDKTFTIDLRKDIEIIFNNFEKSAKYPINKALRDGVHVKKAKEDKEYIDFYNFFTNFSKIKKIPEIEFKELKSYDLFYALSKEGEYLGGCAFVKDSNKSIYRYKHGATSYKYNENDLLIWEALKNAKEEGYLIFDLGGVTLTDDISSYYYRHYRFKKKFGGNLNYFYTYLKAKFPVNIIIYFLKIILIIFLSGDFNKFINFIHKVNKWKK